MSYKIFNRNNTPHRSLGHCHRRMTMVLTHTGSIQLSSFACEMLGVKDGDGVVLLQDDQFDDFYLGRGDVTRGAFVLRQQGKSGRIFFQCSGVSEILGKAAIAPQDWHWMRLELFAAHDGMLGIDVKHATYPRRPKDNDTTAAREALAAKYAAQRAAETEAPAPEPAPAPAPAKKRGRPRKEAAL